MTDVIASPSIERTSGAIARQPFAILGAIGLLSLASDFLQFHQWIADWIAAWKAVTRPIWEMTLGRVLAIWGITLADWVKDYLTAGLIVGGMRVRARFYFRATIKQISSGIPDGRLRMMLFGVMPVRLKITSTVSWALLLLSEWIMQLLIWPHSLFRSAWNSATPHLTERRRNRRGLKTDPSVMQVSKDSIRVYFETILWVALIIAVNYGLWFG